MLSNIRSIQVCWLGFACGWLVLACGPRHRSGETTTVTTDPTPPDDSTVGPGIEGSGATGPSTGNDEGTTTAGTEDPTLPPPLPIEPPPPTECTGDPLPRAAVQVLPAEITGCQDGFTACSGRMKIRIQNCGPGLLVLQTIDVHNPPGHDGSMTLNFPPDKFLRVGESVEHEAFVSWEGVHQVEVHAAERDGTTIALAPVSGTVTNPVLAAARAECDACRGTWGAWGINQSQGCNCATNDAGKVCRDGTECEGQCLFDRFEEVSPGMGVPVGHCSDVQTIFGCHPMIREGASADPPQSLPGRSPTICVD